MRRLGPFQRNPNGDVRTVESGDESRVARRRTRHLLASGVDTGVDRRAPRRYSQVHRPARGSWGLSTDVFSEHIGALGARDRSVFINCPFDADYAPLRDALVFGTVCAGLLPRSADDLGQVSVPRMARLTAALAGCRYSIHDLSRCRGEGELNHARFNMPLELGIAMAYKCSGGRETQHDWLAIVPEGHVYMHFVSDLAGFDPRRHDGTALDVVRATTAWLWTLKTAVKKHRPGAVYGALTLFTAARQQLDAEFAEHPPWSLVYEAALGSVPASM